MIRRLINNQWSGGIAAHPAPKFPSAKIRWKSSRLNYFGDQNDILLIGYLQKGQTINAEYYLSLLEQLKDILKEKRSGKFIKRVSFMHDNAPAHRPLATQEKLTYLGFHCLDYPPYSPDLRKQLKVRHFSSDAEVIAAAEPRLDGKLSEFFFS